MSEPGELRAVFLGSPGAGKGTQAQRLAAGGGVAHISTGEMLRAQVAAGSDLGRKAKGYMDQGQLVPDDLIIAMVADRIDEPDALRAWILDGFPRTLPQAEAFDASLRRAGRELSHVVHFEVPHADLLTRLTGRLMCSGCGAIWHVQFSPTRQEGVCDKCGGSLQQRSDDRLEAVEKRLEVYRRQTEPLLGYYRSRGVMVDIDAGQAPDLVFEDLSKALAEAHSGGR